MAHVSRCRMDRMVVVAVAAGAVLACQSEAAAREAKMLDEAKLSVRESLRDPESAQFRNLRVKEKPSGAIVCGEVNAKNGFGGYEGFERFVYQERLRLVTFAASGAEVVDVACQ